jgi:hypothetical protein
MFIYSFQPDRESTPVPASFNTDESPDEDEILKSDPKSTLEKTLEEIPYVEKSVTEISEIAIPAAGNDDSFLSMFASMKVEETKEVISLPQNFDSITFCFCLRDHSVNTRNFFGTFLSPSPSVTSFWF